jgi:hypothetical protein
MAILSKNVFKHKTSRHLSGLLTGIPKDSGFRKQRSAIFELRQGPFSVGFDRNARICRWLKS